MTGISDKGTTTSGIGRTRRGGPFGGFARLAVLCLAAVPVLAAEPSAQRTAGTKPGLWYWTLPNTPNQLKPVQSWSGAAGAPNGDIYVAGMNHVDNAALYRLSPAGGDATKPGLTLMHVGNAKAASQAAANYQPGEPIEKFHTQPVWQRTKVYVANLNDSLLDTGYLSRRGFHWYGYDWTTGQSLRDLSATEPGGVGAPHGGLLSLVVDRARNRIYGASSPTGDIHAYDIANATTTNLGRPNYQRPYVYAGRAMWLSSQGRVYFTAGNNLSAKYGAPYSPAIFNHVYYYDPVTGFGEEKSWALHNQRAIDAAQCFGNPRICYLMDNVGHVYRYAESPSAPPSWSYLGSVGQQQDEKFGFTWVFHVRPDQKKAYILARRGQFFEFDIPSGVATLITNLYQAEPSFKDLDFYGFNAWDSNGRFYFAAFPKTGFTPKNTKLVAIDPARFLAAIKAAR